MFLFYARTHLVRVVDGDFQPSENLPLWRMLIHGQLKHALRAVLAVERGRVVVQVNDAYHHCCQPKVHRSAFRTHL